MEFPTLLFRHPSYCHEMAEKHSVFILLYLISSLPYYPPFHGPLACLKASRASAAFDLEPWGSRPSKHSTRKPPLIFKTGRNEDPCQGPPNDLASLPSLGTIAPGQRSKSPTAGQFLF